MAKQHDSLLFKADLFNKAGKLPIIGVGGIDSLIAAREKMAAGASLIQIYSGFIFHGPRLIKDIFSDI